MISTMYRFSETSRHRLSTCMPQVQAVCFEAIKVVDFTVLCGIRGQAAQEQAYASGKSKVRFPHSAHNPTWHYEASRAVDVIPYFHTEPHYRHNDIRSFLYLGGILYGIATAKGFNWRWGGDWNRNGVLNFYDGATFNDLYHHEILL